MYSEQLRLTIIFIVLAVLQVLIGNHIHLFHFATPLFYVYLPLVMRRGALRWAMLVWAFSMGLLMDTFNNTPGVASGSMTLLALLQPYLLERMLVHEGDENLIPSAVTMGQKQFAYYTFIFVGLYCMVFYTLELFSFFNFLVWAGCVIGSTLITSVLILTIESVRRKKD
jgi:rod shape-determining protein MreD